MAVALRFDLSKDPDSLVDSLERGFVPKMPIITSRCLEFKDRASTFGIQTARYDGVDYLFKYPLANGRDLGAEIDSYVDLVNDLAKIVREEFQSSYGCVEINRVFRCDIARRGVIGSELREGRSFGEIYEDAAGWGEKDYGNTIKLYTALIKDFRAFTSNRCLKDLGVDLTPEENVHRPSQVWDSFIVPSQQLNDFPRTVRVTDAPIVVAVNPISFSKFREAFYSGE